MIYFIGLISGFLNGIFASGAGQVVVFYLVFIKKIDSHIGRSTSIAILCISSILSLFNYMSFIKFKISYIISIIIIAVVGGLIGSKLMNKIDSKVLNLISGVIMTSLAIYGMVK